MKPPSANARFCHRATLSLIISLVLQFGTVASGAVLSLDGSNDYAQATGTIYPNSAVRQSFTFETWFYPRTANHFISTDDSYDLKLVENGTKVSFKMYASPTNSSTPLDEPRYVILNHWNHVAVMFDATDSHMTIAVNGTISTTPIPLGATGLWVDTNLKFTLSPSGGFNGYMDEVRISDNVRYNANFSPSYTFTTDSHTKALFHFDESAGSTSFADASGNGNTLTGHGAQTVAIDRPITISGDFNGDGSVNAADYVFWRKTSSLADGFSTWRTNFGRTFSSGTLDVGTVLEPAPLTLVVFALTGGLLSLRRHAGR